MASTTLPVPASPLERIIAAPSAIRRSASPKFGRATDEGDGELPFVDVERLVGGCEYLGLVDVVDAERLQYLRFDEVADPAFAMTGIDTASMMLVDHVGVGHASHPAVLADVSRALARGP